MLKAMIIFTPRLIFFLFNVLIRNILITSSSSSASSPLLYVRILSSLEASQENTQLPTFRFFHTSDVFMLGKDFLFFLQISTDQLKLLARQQEEFRPKIRKTLSAVGRDDGCRCLTVGQYEMPRDYNLNVRRSGERSDIATSQISLENALNAVPFRANRSEESTQIE